MIGALFGTMVLVLFAVLFMWLARSAWTNLASPVRWGGVVIAGLLAVVFAAGAIMAGRGVYLFYFWHRAVPVPAVTVAGTPQQVARGEHLSAVICAGCHAKNQELPLSGGPNLADDIGLPAGDLYPPNVTPAGEISGWSDGEVMRAIRQAVHKNGRNLLMPSQNLRNLSDEDTQSIVAYLRKQPADQNKVPEFAPNAFGAMLIGSGLVSLDVPPISGPVTSPLKAATAEYGQYIVSYSDCRDCHGQRLDGKVSPPNPPGPPLVMVPLWTREQFISTMRTGTDPTGYQIKPPMPWKPIGKLDDEELSALYLYVNSVVK